MGRNEKPNDRLARGIYSASTSGVSTAQDFLKPFKMHTFKRTQFRAPLARGIYSASTQGVPRSSDFLNRFKMLTLKRTQVRAPTRAFSPITPLMVLVCLLPWLSPAAEMIQSDVCIYGGTAAGVAAAVEAARSGKTAVIAEFGNHLGGMTSGGLSQTDIGNKGAIGGIAREFYRRMGKHYGKEEQWLLEPSVAENIFFEFVNETKTPVYVQQHLASVKKEGARISEITM